MYRVWKTTVAAALAAVSLGVANTAQAEDVNGWWPYNGNQPNWHCETPSKQFAGDIYEQACVSLGADGTSFQALVHLNSTADGYPPRVITINVMDDINGVDQAGSDRTCGVGGPTNPGEYVCFAHTITAPHGANAGVWLTVSYGDGVPHSPFHDFYSVVR